MIAIDNYLSVLMTVYPVQLQAKTKFKIMSEFSDSVEDETLALIVWEFGTHSQRFWANEFELTVCVFYVSSWSADGKMRDKSNVEDVSNTEKQSKFVLLFEKKALSNH